MKNQRSDSQWRLEGWDTFSREPYPIRGSWSSEAEAMEAALRELETIEKMQPTETSGGQSGIQDHVYVVAPTGEKVRVWPGG
ncbi:MAG: hypothetical protein CMO55_06630 [Verrucomicrobiales bacterium]|nr:hypothetical protein [Verrucomicrobiales bacterium]